MMTTSTVTTSAPNKGMNIALWVVQVLLAASFGLAGFSKTTMPIADLTAEMVWPGALPEWLVRFIGASEFAGALGLLLPALTRIRPNLTVLAAYGLLTVMVLAAGFHASRGEYSAIGFNAILGALAAFVAWGRSKKAPITPK